MALKDIRQEASSVAHESEQLRVGLRELRHVIDRMSVVLDSMERQQNLSDEAEEDEGGDDAG